MKTKHTPGPWFYDETWGLIHDARKSAKGPHKSAAEICAIHAGRTGKKDEAQANARLIAAAPELLAACEFALERLEIDGRWAQTQANIRAAIQKARGEG